MPFSPSTRVTHSLACSLPFPSSRWTDTVEIQSLELLLDAMREPKRSRMDAEGREKRLSLSLSLSLSEERAATLAIQSTLFFFSSQQRQQQQNQHLPGSQPARREVPPLRRCLCRSPPLLDQQQRFRETEQPRGRRPRRAPALLPGRGLCRRGQGGPRPRGGPARLLPQLPGRRGGAL